MTHSYVVCGNVQGWQRQECVAILKHRKNGHKEAMKKAAKINLGDRGCVIDCAVAKVSCA